MHVIVTRPAREAQGWVQSLHSAGFQASSLPLIDIAGPPEADAVVRAWHQLETCDAAMFVSGNAVEHFFALKPPGALVYSAQAAIKTRAMVTGPGSLSALQRAGVDASYIDVPPLELGQFDSESLWAVVHHRVGPGYRVLVVRGTTTTTRQEEPVPDAGVGRDWFSRKVIAAGGQVEFVVAYQRRCPASTPEIQEAVRAAVGHQAVWLFSSSEAVANLQSLAPRQQWGAQRAVCTHARIAQAAREAGFGVVCESRPVLAAVVASIESLQ